MKIVFLLAGLICMVSSQLLAALVINSSSALWHPVTYGSNYPDPYSDQ